MLFHWEPRGKFAIVSLLAFSRDYMLLNVQYVRLTMLTYVTLFRGSTNNSLKER